MVCGGLDGHDQARALNLPGVNMADLESIHRVVEKLEVQGTAEAKSQIDKVAAATDKFSKSLDTAADKTDRLANDMVDVIEGSVVVSRALAKVEQQANRTEMAMDHFRGIVKYTGDTSEQEWEEIGDVVVHQANRMETALVRISDSSERALDHYFDLHQTTGKTSKNFEDMNKKSKKTESIFEDIGGWADKLKKKFAGLKGPLLDMLKPLALASIALSIVGDLVGTIVQGIKDLLTRWWHVNKAAEAMQGRMRGISYALVDWKDGTDKVVASQRLANVLMDEFRDASIDMGIPIAELEGAFARLDVVVSGLGKSQADVLKYTRLTAAAAKIYGSNIDDAGTVVSKAIVEGIVEGESQFARAFQTQLGALPGQGFQKLPVEERATRIMKLLETMGASVGLVSTDTASVMTRWKTFADDILGRLTYPIFQKIGGAMQSLLDYALENRSTIESIVDRAAHWANLVWDLVATFAKVGWWSIKIWNFVTRTTEKFGLLAQFASLFLEATGLIGDGWRLIEATVDYISNPDQGLGKLATLSDAVNLRLRQMFRILMDIGKWALKALGGDKIAAMAEKLPVVGKQFKDYMGQMRAADQYFTNRLEADEAKLDERRIKYGLDPTTEAGERARAKRLGKGMSKEEREKLLKSLFGTKRPLVNVQNMNIQQDFRDIDPDNVAIDFVRTFENLAQEAISSNVGGGDTVFGAGG